MGANPCFNGSSKFLEGYREIEKSGIDWDLPYNGEIHKLHFILYVPFIKGDTVEHDNSSTAYCQVVP